MRGRIFSPQSDGQLDKQKFWTGSNMSTPDLRWFATQRLSARRPLLRKNSRGVARPCRRRSASCPTLSDAGGGQRDEGAGSSIARGRCAEGGRWFVLVAQRLSLYFPMSGRRRLHAALADEGRGFGRRHELDQRLCGSAMLRHRQHADAEIDVALQLRRQGADVVSAGNGQNDVDLLHPDLGFPLCHDLGHRNAVHELDLVLQLLGDTEPLH